jgi:hypothetical protein
VLGWNTDHYLGLGALRSDFGGGGMSWGSEVFAPSVCISFPGYLDRLHTVTCSPEGDAKEDLLVQGQCRLENLGVFLPLRPERVPFYAPQLEHPPRT